MTSAAGICNSCGINGHLRTVQRLLKASTNLKFKKIKAKPALLARHKTARLEFAKAHMSWTKEWRKVIFSDEKKFNLDGPDGYHFYWHDLRKEEKILSRRQMGGGSLMVWAAIGWKNNTEIIVCSSKMNQENYKEILQENILGKGYHLAGPEFVFQQDNASIHTALSVKQWFSTKKLRVMEWPAKSPDLNIIENLWGTLSRKVYANGRQFHSTLELQDSIKTCWKQISRKEVQSLYNSLPNRIFEVINKNGACTHY